MHHTGHIGKTALAQEKQAVTFAAKIYQVYPDSHQFKKLNLQLQVSKK